jgi:Family of unknown function (DUF6152)
MTRGLIRTLGVALLAATALPAFAHHSFAMFDMAKTISWQGTVKEVQWTNPHVWVALTVTENGKPVDLNFEAAAVPVLKNAGWTKDTVKAGDSITIVGHPYKDGRAGGSIDHVLLADGRKVGAGDAIPPPLVVPGVK